MLLGKHSPLVHLTYLHPQNIITWLSKSLTVSMAEQRFTVKTLAEHLFQRFKELYQGNIFQT